MNLMGLQLLILFLIYKTMVHNIDTFWKVEVRDKKFDFKFANAVVAYNIMRKRLQLFKSKAYAIFSEF